MKINKVILAFATIALILSAIPQSVSAQMSVGASYELRDEEPISGFGIRIERALLEKAPIVNLGLRAHISYFNDNIILEESGYSNDISNYDYGLAAVGGVSVGMISPYVGVGVGASTMEVSRAGSVNRPENSEDTSFYWNGLVGGKITVLPIQPFVEYRLDEISDYENELGDVERSSGRLIFGVSLSF